MGFLDPLCKFPGFKKPDVEWPGHQTDPSHGCGVIYYTVSLAHDNNTTDPLEVKWRFLYVLYTFMQVLRYLVGAGLTNRIHFIGAIRPPYPQMRCTPPPPKDAPAAVQ